MQLNCTKPRIYLYGICKNLKFPNKNLKDQIKAIIQESAWIPFTGKELKPFRVYIAIRPMAGDLGRGVPTQA